MHSYLDLNLKLLAFTVWFGDKNILISTLSENRPPCARDDGPDWKKQHPSESKIPPFTRFARPAGHSFGARRQSRASVETEESLIKPALQNSVFSIFGNPEQALLGLP